MATVLLSLGTAPATSTTITLNAAEGALLQLVTADGQAPVSETRFAVDFLSLSGAWIPYRTLGQSGALSATVPNGTTFRARRLDSGLHSPKPVGLSMDLLTSSGGGTGTGAIGTAATAAKQDVGNSYLASFDAKLPPPIDGAVPVVLTAPTNARVRQYAASLVAKASAGVLYGLSGYNSSESEQFIQLHDAAAVPNNGAVPEVLVRVAPLSPFSLDYGPRGRAFASGIVVCNSTTGPTKTLGSADCWFDAQVG